MTIQLEKNLQKLNFFFRKSEFLHYGSSHFGGESAIFWQNLMFKAALCNSRGFERVVPNVIYPITLHKKLKTELKCEISSQKIVFEEHNAQQHTFQTCNRLQQAREVLWLEREKSSINNITLAQVTQQTPDTNSTQIWGHVLYTIVFDTKQRTFISTV